VMLTWLVMIAVVCLVFWAVFTGNKTVGAVAQFGNLQERAKAQERLAQSVTEGSEFTSKSHRQIEKLVFTLSVLNVGLTCYVLGTAPGKFYIWHSVKAVTLITARWLDFKKKGDHYLLYDFCYWANLLTLIYIWMCPDWPMLFQIIFMISNGPLAWSVLAFNQALVFHKWQNMTSVFIHVSPMMFSWGLRWFSSEHGFAICADPPECVADLTSSSLLWAALLRFYVWWIVLYYVWLFVINGEYIKSRGFNTLYDRVSTKQLRFLFQRIDASDLVKKAFYMLLHLVFGILTMLLASIFWFNREAHLTFIIVMCVASAWNASAHYEEVFTGANQKYRQIVEPPTASKHQ